MSPYMNTLKNIFYDWHVVSVLQTASVLSTSKCNNNCTSNEWSIINYSLPNKTLRVECTGLSERIRLKICNLHNFSFNRIKELVIFIFSCFFDKDPPKNFFSWINLFRLNNEFSLHACKVRAIDAINQRFKI